MQGRSIRNARPQEGSMKTYSTSAAARIAKCSADTIRRACQSEDLKAEMVEGKRGLTWRVDENALYDWIDGRNREKNERLQEHRSTAADEDSTTAAQAQHPEIDSAAGPQEDSSTAGVAALQATLHKALEVAQEQRADRLEAERRAEEAEENAFRMARRIQDLMHEMESHKRLLSENVESLQKDRAKVLEQEAKVKELELVRRQEAARLEELHQHRAEEKAVFEQEKQRLKDEMEALKAEAEAKSKAEEALGLMATDLQALKIEMASKEAEWAEQRKPWYKKLFGKKAQ